MEELFAWLMKLPQIFGEFGNWLVTPLQYINLSPLALFGVAGITAIVAMKAVRLFVGG